MTTKINLRLSPAAADEALIKKSIADSLSVKLSAVTGYHLLKKSIDARSKQVYFNLTVEAFINEPFRSPTPIDFNFVDVTHAAKKIIIIGAGPAGIFAAIKCIEAGIKPIILERGKDVKSRRRDLATLNKEGIINPESNYCFGEGGAGT